MSKKGDWINEPSFSWVRLDTVRFPLDISLLDPWNVSNVDEYSPTREIQTAWMAKEKKSRSTNFIVERNAFAIGQLEFRF